MLCAICSESAAKSRYSCSADPADPTDANRLDSTPPALVGEAQPAPEVAA